MEKKFSCKNCIWFEPFNEGQGLCHRFPPEPGFGFIQVGKESYCGEWRAELPANFPLKPLDFYSNALL